MGSTSVEQFRRSPAKAGPTGIVIQDSKQLGKEPSVFLLITRHSSPVTRDSVAARSPVALEQNRIEFLNRRTRFADVAERQFVGHED